MGEGVLIYCGGCVGGYTDETVGYPKSTKEGEAVSGFVGIKIDISATIKQTKKGNK